jgi:hypothetical protein
LPTACETAGPGVCSSWRCSPPRRKVGVTCSMTAVSNFRTSRRLVGPLTVIARATQPTQTRVALVRADEPPRESFG